MGLDIDRNSSKDLTPSFAVHCHSHMLLAWHGASYKSHHMIESLHLIDLACAVMSYTFISSEPW